MLKMDAERNIKKRFTVSMVTSLILDKNFESDSSQSSESEHENEDETLRDMQTLYCTLMGSKARGKMIATEKITDYVDRVIPNYSDIAFKEYFRMFPATFEMILSLIGPALNKTNTVTGTKPISVEKQLYITLWFMATPDSYRSVCVKFGVGKTTAFRAVRRVTYALHCMAPRFIQWPDEAVATNISDQFLEASGFPNVIGAIDGTQIKIRAPPTDSVSYINRKGFPSIFK
ncbi:PREDICTED: putative nuclease HARBI1 [Trachymyrmex cornetzi]|uniref:putative nuclease HARBI1 n=1 Tax=Trachymyrmex cornetzi TaxID=471704 RepID=UPI00084EE5CB|nr:PREDICTED: putative nuclease HARBI1 [Trachymyrmex cornetzi]